MDWGSLAIWLLFIAIWTLLVRAFPDILTKSIASQVQHNYDKQLEKLRGEIQASNAAIRTSVDYLTTSQTEFRSKAISSVEALWSGIEKIQQANSTAVGMTSILTSDELDACMAGRKQPDMRSVLFEKYGDRLQHSRDTLAKIRKDQTGSEIFYVSTRLWLLYQTIIAAHGRISFLIGLSLEDNRYHDWRNDKPMISILGKALSKDQMKDLPDHTFGGTLNVFHWLKAEFIKEASDLVRGSSELAHSVSEIHDILKSAVDNSYQSST